MTEQGDLLQQIGRALDGAGITHMVADFARHLAVSDWRLEPLTDADLHRVVELLDRYADARLGSVDASIVAIAERLGVRRIHTLDHRHFAPIRPAHLEAFELLP